MAVTVNLKPKVDLPVWEWCRPLPVAVTAVSSTCHSPDNRYIYYIVASALYRYDTVSDSWAQLATIPASIGAPATLAQMEYSTSHGHYGRTISNGGGLNTIELGALQGNVFVGKKIKIIGGTGAGQERTITAVSAPIIKDRGVVTSATTNTIADGSAGVMLKQWKINQWRDYQARVLHGGLANSLVRPILYNTYNTLVYSDITWSSITPWWGPTLSNTSATAGSQTQYQIESNIVTVDSNWTVQPNSTSEFVIMSDGIWLITTNAAGGFYNLFYYDVAADMWFNKTNNSGLFTAALGTDVAIEVVQASSDALVTGTLTSATSSSATDSSKTLTPAFYTNLEMRFLSGSSTGQSRTLLTNTSSTFIPVRNWETTPTIGDTYGVFRDVGKIYIIGGGTSIIAQYDIDADLAYCGKRFDYGIARAASATLSNSGIEPIAIGTIVRTTGGISVLNATPTAAGTGYLANQILTITTGGTGGTARILSVDANGGVTAVELETSGSGYTAGTGRSTTVAPAGGSGCTLNITTVAEIATVTTASSVAHPFRIGDVVTIAGAVQADYNGSKTIISQGTAAPTTATTFAYVVLNSPATPATYTNTQAATTLFDISKSWVTNEHIGKLVYVTQSVSPNATGSIRRITANTSNSLTFATITTAAANGTGRYVIFSDKAFGTDESIGSVLGASTYSGRGRSGVATSGTTTSLTDSSKNWAVNYWSNTFPTGASNTGRKVRITKGTGAGTEMVITSNTATTLNFATQSFTPDATSVYVILDCYGIATTGGTTTLTDNTQNWGTNIWSGKRIRITGGTGFGNEAVINSNTQTTLTLATTITTDTTSTYAILASNNKGAGIHMFDITDSSDTSLNSRYIYMFRGGGTNEIARYNIITEEIDNFTTFPFSETLAAGSMYAYDGVDRIYFQKDATGRIYYYDITKNTVTNSSTIPYGMGTALIGNRMEITQTEDGLKYIYVARHSAQEWWRCLLFW
jgi:hypothetical protein